MCPNAPKSLPAAPTVSVIIPVYNGADTIAACLDSLLEQAYPAEAYDIIVVENGSTDDTTAIVRRHTVGAVRERPRLRLLYSDRRGPAAARNVGIAASEADIVAFTDADCIADANWLSELAKPFANPAVGGVGGTILPHMHADRTIVEMFSEEHPPLVNFRTGDHEFLPHLYTANAAFRRSLVRQVGDFNPNMVTGEDVDLSWRIQLQTGSTLYDAPKAIIYHHHRSTRAALARQYRQYGFGEIVLDALYGQCPGYPRSRAYQVCRIAHQVATLPRYALSAILRRFKLGTRQTTPYDAAIPGLWFLIESSNIRGKIDGLIATRFMRDAQSALNLEPAVLIARFY